MKTTIKNLKRYFLVFLILFSAGAVATLSAESPAGSKTDLSGINSIIVEIFLDHAVEPQCMMEPWMNDVSYWNSWSVEVAEDVAEEDLEINGWMLNTGYWNSGDNIYHMEAYEEVALEIQEWMTDPCHWEMTEINHCADFIKTDIQESNLPVNDWMKDMERWVKGS